LKRTIAFDVTRFALNEVRPILQKSCARSDQMEFHRFFLSGIRDRLDTYCRLFQADAACEDHQDLYLPLFDALGLINMALGVKPVYVAAVRLAAQSLDQLQADLATTPAACN
jgi:hypothetical protein